MIQPGRFSGRFKIHETTRVWAIVEHPGSSPAWRSFPIIRRTARKVIITTPTGDVRIDRIPLEQNGRAVSHGTVYHLSRFALPAADSEDIAA